MGRRRQADRGHGRRGRSRGRPQPHGRGERQRFEQRATPENPRYSLQDPALWDEVLGGGTATESGVTVTHKKALAYAPVWQAVSLISGAVAKLPLDVYRRREDLGETARERDTSHPAWPLVRRQPNAEVGAVKFWRRFMVHALLWNRAFAYIERDDNGTPIGLYNLLPDRTGPERVRLPGQRDPQLIYVTEAGQDAAVRLRALYPSEVLHVEGITTDNLDGCDLVESARNSWGLGLAAERFSSRFFKNGLRSSGILELPREMTKPAQDNVEEGFRKKHEGPDNWFKTVVLRDGAKFHSVQVKPEEGQVHELREDQVRDVARWFNLQPSKLGLADSVSYNSKTEDNQAFLDDTLAIWLLLMTSECDLKLLAAAEQASHFFEHNTGALLRLNPVQRHAVYATGIRAGMYSPNDCRARENLPPREGGDSYADVTRPQGAAAPAKTEPVAEPATEPEPEEKSGGVIRARAAFAIAARARHKAANPRAFVEWIDTDLAALREEFRGLLGPAEPEVFGPPLADLKRIAETVGESDLPAVVDAAMTRYEQQHAA